jgi:peptide/nickel transport system ATP-binding protein
MNPPTHTDRIAAQVTGLTAVAGGRRLLSEVSCTVGAGRILAVVGPSGSGKTTLGRALLGEAGPGVTLTGTVTVADRPVRPDTPPPGGTVAYVPQHPAAALNPVRRVGGVLREIAHRHRAGARRADLHRTVLDVLTRVGLATDRAFLRRYPHQLSGGQQQRLVIAHALLSGARLLVADEPTTGQDGPHRTEVAAQLRRLAGTGVAVVLLSHDLHLIRAVADDTIVLDRGTLTRSGPPNDVLPPPDAGTGGERPVGDTDPSAPPVLRTTGLVARHGGATVLHGVEATIAAGRCLAVVGRSGSGKTTLARCIAGLHQPTTGTVELDGRALAGTLERRSRADLAAVQYVFQDPRASFQPDLPVLDQVARAAARLHGTPTGQARTAAQTVLDEVGINTDQAGRTPHRLSGGELQRAAIARALSTVPRLLICDEITSGLDAAVQDQILTVLEQLRDTRRLALLVISHDAEVVARLADDILVLDHGQILEHGPAAALIDAGRAPLTRALLDPHVPPIKEATANR